MASILLAVLMTTAYLILVNLDFNGAFNEIPLALGPAGLAAFFGDISVGKQDPCPLALEAVAPNFQTSEGGKKGDQVADKKSGKEKK